MKLAFRNAACSELHFQAAAEMAHRCNFDGVELHAIESASVASDIDAILAAPEKIAQPFADLNVDILSLFVGDDLGELIAWIELAAEIKCASVRLGSDRLFNRGGVISPATAHALLKAGDVAAGYGVSILIDNQNSRGAMTRLWRLVDRLNHPSIGCSWNTLHAAQAGDNPAVAVPTLNSRIRSVHLQDARISNHTTLNCELGDGELPIRKTMNRLRGLGFGGNVILELAEQVGKTAEEFEQSLTRALVVLQQWQIAKALAT